MLSKPEILARCNDIWGDTWALPNENEIQARTRGGRHFVGIHRLVKDAGGTQAVIDACKTATDVELEEAGFVAAGTINPNNIAALIAEIMAMIQAFKPPVPTP